MKRLLFTIVCVMVFGIVDFANAVVIAPTVFDQIKIESGSTLVEKIQVYNDSSLKKVFDILPINFVSRDETGTPVFTNSNDGLASWINSASGPVELEQDTETEISFEINVPEGTEPGGYYAAVFIQEVVVGQNDGLGVSSNVGSLLLVEVVGEQRESSSLVEFGTGDQFTNRLPIEFFTRVKNEGTVHFKPSGFIKIRNMFEVEVASIPINPIEGSVLPNSTRHLETYWIKNLDIDEQGFFTELKNEFKNFGLGKYRAELELIWSETQDPLVGEVVFWVIPRRLIGSIVAGVVLLLLLSKSRRLFG